MLNIDDRWVRWLLVPAIVFISQATNDAYLVDFWHHLARGQHLLATGEMLNHDIVSYTVPGTKFVDVNWLTQAIFAGLYSLGGLGLVRTMNALTLAGAFAGLVAICKRESGSLEIAMAVGLTVFVGTWQVLTIRPQTISIVLFVGLYDVLLRAEKDPRWLLATPMFLAIWANVHGAFPAGIILVGAFGAGVFLSRGGWEITGFPVWILALLACVTATLVNPYGIEIYRYAAATSGISARRGIDEWLPPSWDQGVGVAFFVSLPIVLGVFAWSRRLSWRETFLMAIFGIMAARSVRMTPWWLIVIAPMLAVRLANFWPTSRSVKYEPSRAAALTVFGLLAMCAISLPPLHAFNPLLRWRGESATTANLDLAYERIAAKDPASTVFSKLEWGEYLGWRGRGSWNRIFMDGRIEIYPDAVWDDYMKITRGEMAPNADFAVLDAEFHGRTGLLAKMREFGFEEIDRFGDVIVYARKGSR